MLKILYANVNSYVPKKHIINNIIEKNKINCSLFVETKTKENSSTHYKNWDVLQFNGNMVNNNTRGGSLVQVDPTLKMNKENPPRINNPLNEATHFSIQFQGDKLHILLVYIHPTSNIEETIFTKAALYKYCIIIGDFNVNRTKNRQLQTFLNNSSFKKADTPPTFLMMNNPDTTPDLLLYTNNIENNINKIETHPDIGSDHLAIEVNIKLDKTISAVEEKERINIHKCDTEKVSMIIEKYIEESQHLPIDEQTINSFNKKLTETIIHNSPKRKTKFYLHELPPFIIKLIKNKRKMYRDYLLNKNEEYKRLLNTYNKNIQKLIREYKEHKWINACNEINQQQGKNYWQQIRKLSRYKQTSHITTLEENGKFYNNDLEKVELFAQHFEKTYTIKNDNQFDETNYEDIRNWSNNFFSEELQRQNKAISEETYFEILNKGKSTAPGKDNISKNIIRKLGYNVHLYIIRIYEYCLNNQYFPTQWKQGIVITIPKSNTNHHRVDNYRPIVLLSVLAKNLEQIIKKLIFEAIGHNIPNYQFGFRENCSTTHPLTIITSNIQTSKLEGYHSAAIFIDITKAFDSVWHEGLLYKLAVLNCPRYLIFIIKNYLKERTLQIKINTSYSKLFKTQQGLPQGSPLSPLLYNIYCYDIYNFEKHLQYFNPKTYILQYADDTALISHDRTLEKTVVQLQELMNRTMTWFNKWRLKPNPTKSQYIIFNHAINNNSPTVTINHHILPAQPTVKYLGVSLDNKLNFNDHTKYIKKRCIARSKHFRCMTYKNEGISKKTAAHIYKSICRPILEYGHPLFLNVRKPAIKNINVAETSALRIITKYRHPTNPLHNPPNALLYQITKTDPIPERLSKLSTKFAKADHNMEILRPLCKTRNRQTTSNRKFPQKTLWEHINELRTA